MRSLVRNGGKVLLALDLMIAVLVFANLAAGPAVVAIITCIGRSLNGPPCAPVEIHGPAGTSAYVVFLVIASPSLLAGLWWLMRRAGFGRGSRTNH